MQPHKVSMLSTCDDTYFMDMKWHQRNDITVSRSTQEVSFYQRQFVWREWLGSALVLHQDWTSLNSVICRKQRFFSISGKSAKKQESRNRKWRQCWSSGCGQVERATDGEGIIPSISPIIPLLCCWLHSAAQPALLSVLVLVSHPLLNCFLVSTHTVITNMQQCVS